jgi:hypothetical protein
LDLAQESLDEYSDAQVGAAARDVLRDSRKVLERLFALKPLLDQEEGAAVEVPTGFDAGRFRLSGNVTGQPPFRGRLVHHGWQATIASCRPGWAAKRRPRRCRRKWNCDDEGRMTNDEKKESEIQMTKTDGMSIAKMRQPLSMSLLSAVSVPALPATELGWSDAPS